MQGAQLGPRPIVDAGECAFADKLIDTHRQVVIRVGELTDEEMDRIPHVSAALAQLRPVGLADAARLVCGGAPASYGPELAAEPVKTLKERLERAIAGRDDLLKACPDMGPTLKLFETGVPSVALQLSPWQWDQDAYDMRVASVPVFQLGLHAGLTPATPEMRVVLRLGLTGKAPDTVQALQQLVQRHKDVMTKFTSLE